LNVINIHVPPLRDRREDIVPIAEFLLRKHTAPGAALLSFPPGLKDVLVDYHWPGNVRELENTIRNFQIFQDGESLERELRAKLRKRNVLERGSVLPITLHDGAYSQAAGATLPVTPEITGANHGSLTVVELPVLEQVAKAKREAERAAILAVLKTTNWNRKQAAALLHIDYKALLYKMKGLSIKKEKTPRPELAVARTGA